METVMLHTADGSLPFKTQKYGSLPEQSGPVSLKPFNHHAATRQYVLLCWYGPRTKATPAAGGGNSPRAERRVKKEM